MSNLPTVEGFARLFEEFEKTPVAGRLFTGEHGACALGVLGLHQGFQAYHDETTGAPEFPYEFNQHGYAWIADGFDAAMQRRKPVESPLTDRGDPFAREMYDLGYAVGLRMLSAPPPSRPPAPPQPPAKPEREPVLV